MITQKYNEIKYCNTCHCRLTDENWLSCLKNKLYMCKDCYNKQDSKRREKRGIKLRIPWGGKCRVCGIELNDNNWCNSNKENHYYICIQCGSIKSRTYNIQRREKDPVYGKKIADYSKKHRKDIKQLIITEYGGKCECCGETNKEFLTIDHVDGNGSEHRRKIGIGCGNAFYIWLKNNNFPKDNYRLLCMNCNFSIGMYGYCPHQKSGES